MATWIKAGFWEKLCKPCKGYKGWLNLDQLIQSVVGDIYSRETMYIPLPPLDGVVNIKPSKTDTTVIFEGTISNSFTINIDGSSSVPGNRLYIFLEPTVIDPLVPPIITFTGDIAVTLCGQEQNYYELYELICIEVISNGIRFIGIDNC